MKLRQILVVVALAALIGCESRRGPAESGTDRAAATTRPETNPTSKPDTRPKAMHWGPVDPRGLQLGAWINSGATLRCLIRNQGDRSVRYSDYLLGDYWDCKSVAVRGRPRGAGQWRIIPSHKLVHYRKSAGASVKNVHVIQPGQDMPSSYYEEGQKLTSSTCGPKLTFAVHLTGFDWPDSWTGTIEILISQKLGDDGSKDTWTGILKSEPLEISMRKLAPAKFPGSGDWGAVSNGLKCRVTTDRREYRISEPVHVLVEVANVGGSPVSFGCAEVQLAARQGDRKTPLGFFSGAMREFTEATQNGKPFVLSPDRVWKRAMILYPWGPTFSSNPVVASPGKMSIYGIVAFRPDTSGAGRSVQSSTKTFEAKK